ncbi:uncharacterized protein (DUF1015 family) [Nocardioides thalensis]|uniref:Uncharacterized protein (DUF1015 family) n=1 Tax=Nocardioides thalensis TaxID=1914755 RepID=A0A853C2D7_9ACTN|nr:DUF1015 family protein [Nocardioides thalensis]NYJ01504.1 uncharacterized protein (DUF1015 family) [Nocardioides thalensis]
MDSHTVVPPPYIAGPLRLEPFRALRLVPARIGDPSTGRAFARPYKDVANRLSRWQGRGLLVRDEEPALYLHEYSSAGISVRGIVGALDVSTRATRPEDRAVLPHEGIHPAQADDLADRMAEMQLNPAPILLVHRATDAARTALAGVAAQPPDHQFTDRSEQQHRIWAIRDRDLLRLIAGELATSRALIADGHHRYAAYLRLQRRRPGGPCDRGLAMLVDQGDTPLFLGAIHRSLVGTSLDDLRVAVESVGMSYGERDRNEAVAALASTQLAATDGRRWATVGLETGDRAAVEVLHAHIVPALPHGPSAVGFHHSVDEALAQATPGKVTAVLMPAPSFDLVRAIAEADRLLPEKATSFQPKPSLGVFIRSLRDEDDAPS